MLIQIDDALFKERLSVALKYKGVITADSEIFVFNEEDQVMSEPDVHYTSDKSLVLKYSYRNDILIAD